MNGDPQQRFNRCGHGTHRPTATPPEPARPPRGELWGLCDVCDRWFFVAFEPALGIRSPRCPVCASVAVSLDLRLEATS